VKFNVRTIHGMTSGCGPCCVPCHSVRRQSAARARCPGLMKPGIDHGELKVRLDEIRPLLHEFLEPALGFLQMSGAASNAQTEIAPPPSPAQHERVPQMRSGASVSPSCAEPPQVKAGVEVIGSLAARGESGLGFFVFAAAQQSSPINRPCAGKLRIEVQRLAQRCGRSLVVSAAYCDAPSARCPRPNSRSSSCGRSRPRLFAFAHPESTRRPRCIRSLDRPLELRRPVRRAQSHPDNSQPQVAVSQ